jgi:hypothetical protein
MGSVRRGPFRDFYLALLAKGMKPTMAQITCNIEVISQKLTSRVLT